METKIYNEAAYGLPKMRLMDREIALSYSRHAQQEVLNDRFGVCGLPKAVNLSKSKIVEVEVENGKLTKFVVRYPSDASRDLVLVIMPDGFVRTVWVNLKNDNHRSLDKARYHKP